MNLFLERLTEMAPTWGAALGRSAWQGGLALLAVWLLGLTFPKIPARVRCWLWRLAFAKLLIGLVWVAPLKLALLPAPRLASPIASRVAVTQAIRQAPAISALPAPYKTIPGAISAVSARPQWPGLLLMLWTLGVGIGLVRIICQWWVARRMILTSGPLVDAAMETTLASHCGRFGIRSVPELRLSSETGTPFLSGLIRLVIVVPANFPAEKSLRQLQMMLGHELAHVQRRDLWWAWLPTTARLLFFFHPLVWVAAKESRLTAEMAADELALTVCQLEPGAYAGMLVDVAGQVFQLQAEEMVVAVVESSQTLKRRLQAMKHIQTLSNRRTIVAAVACGLIGAGTIIPWKLVAQEQEQKSQQLTAAEPFSARAHMKPEVPAAPQSPGRVEVRIDAAGRIEYGGHFLKLDDAMSALKNSANLDPKLEVEVAVDSKAPFHAWVEFVNELDKAGIDHVALATAAHVSTEAQIFDIAFGVWRPEESKQTGPAAAGREEDYWNTVGVPWINDHTETGLKFASRVPSAVQVRMVNLAGGWGNDGKMGVKAPMFDSYNYPVNNQGGNAQVILTHVPPGKYDVYIYGHESNPVAYGDYTLKVGGRDYGRKATSNKSDAIENTSWVEGSQYVKYSSVEVNASDEMEILIQPGGQVTDHWGRTFSDATINGLQLIPVP
jgi:beta-lactamase regulating signal transducer with metallopeptidase domain/biopolymer transport protein ExbD